MTIVFRFQLTFLKKITFIAFTDFSPNRRFQELYKTVSKAPISMLELCKIECVHPFSMTYIRPKQKINSETKHECFNLVVEL